MTITVEAVYENGVLKPAGPLPFQEHEQVTLTVQSKVGESQSGSAIVPCADAALIEWAAMSPELDFPEPKEAP
jgi:predicted DNA-binding antitoxin AbrB/MazE fold protein